MIKPTKTDIFFKSRIAFTWFFLSLIIISVAACSTSTLKPAEKHELRFVVGADGHWGQPNTAYEQYYTQFIEAVNNLNRSKPIDFVVLIGDLVHDRSEMLPAVKARLDQLVPRYYVVNGNHDHANAEKWEQIWGYPINAMIKEKNYTLLLVNTADSVGNYACADADWLRSSLQQPEAQNVFVFAHITQKNWTQHGIDCPEIMEILTKNKAVQAVFHGHDHDIDEVRRQDKTHFIFTGRFGGSWGGIRQFRVVEVGENGSILIFRYNIESDIIEKIITIEEKGIE